MLKLEEIKKNAAISGIEPGQVVRVVTTEPVGLDDNYSALTLYYKTSDGKLHERMLFRTDEAKLSLAGAGRPWAFDAPGEEFKLAAEAYRINLAHLFDPMMAVHTSNVEPLPHQITAVYESMLPRQPLRYVLADDPGAGKTIMAGLLIRELLMRADAKRVLIVAPGSLVEQWQDEMFEKFGLSFSLFSREQVEQSRSGNPFDDIDLLVARVDQLSRAEDLQEKLRLSHWDLIVVDEAHKLSASYFGNKVNKTKRFQLGELLGSITRHFLLMTATPHNGKEEDFQLFMSLLDSDRFYGKFRDGGHKVDVTDLMRRMVKEEMLRFDGTKLFPERRARTANYKLSDPEAALYSAVTDYVKEEMNRADQLDGQRKGTVGFALTALQRRLASSPEAIYQSLKRRRNKLKRRVEEEKLRQRGGFAKPALAETLGPNGEFFSARNISDDIWDSADSLSPDDYENFEEAVVYQATAAQTIQELEAEIVILEGLEEQARQVVHSGQDRKWDELSKLLQNTPEMRDAQDAAGPSQGVLTPPGGGVAAGRAWGHTPYRQRKLIIFTEHRDTLNYLAVKIRGLIGSEESVVMIHGGVKREERRKVQELFRNDPTTRVLLATDAAGEGVNLQRGAHLMVNYDLPWNPNRLEQRFGRIHRIGQTEVCHLWNLCAANTREGEVYRRLLEKLEEARKALGGKVYDVLGELFEGHALRDLLVDAIRYGDRPEKKAELFRKVDGAVDVETIEKLVAERKLTSEGMNPNSVAGIREQMERAAARRLQPHFIGAFFREAFTMLGGRISEREKGRFEILRVPSILKERDRLIGRSDPVLDRYARITFEKSLIIGQPQAELVAPGHPLLESLVDVILERFQPLLNQGGVLVDETDESLDPKLLVYLEHAIRDARTGRSGEPRAISQRLQFLFLKEDASAVDGGPAPYLDCRPITPEERLAVADAIVAPWLSGNAEAQALGYAVRSLVPDHLNEVRTRRIAEIDKVEREVRARLNREINYWDARAARLREEERAGKEQRINAQNAEAIAARLVERLHRRQSELDRERQISALPPVLKGAALVIPGGLIKAKNKTVPVNKPTGMADDPIQRAETERMAMEAVFAAERALGHEPWDVSAEKKGWDIESRDSRTGHLRFIEVKGRQAEGRDVILTKNEILASLNAPETFILAIVRIDNGYVHEPVYVRGFFRREMEFSETAIVFDVEKLIAMGRAPH